MDRKKFIRAISFLPAIPFLAKSNDRDEGDIVHALCKTQKDQEGPYYKGNAPERAVIETKGEAIVIKGQVLRADDCSTPVAGAVIDIWHCDDHGSYDMSGYKCRGVVRTDAKGNYRFETIYPPSYGNRPRHIHVKIRVQGLKELTTQIYFKDDPFIKNDFARNAEASRVISLNEQNGTKTGIFPIYL
jgi:catechol 1,2-dioxygenase